jgi:hypothetical protein
MKWSTNPSDDKAEGWDLRLLITNANWSSRGPDSIGLLASVLSNPMPFRECGCLPCLPASILQAHPLTLIPVLLLHFRPWFREEFAYGHAFAVAAL